MSCPQNDNTLLWLYGELHDDVHAAHVAACAPCQATVEAHEEVQHFVAPVQGALLPAAAIPPANRPGWWLVGLAIAAAAGLVLFAGGQAPEVDQLDAGDTDLAALTLPVAMDAPFFGDLDVSIEAIELDLAQLSNDFETL
jgi:hypothetical protein